MISHLVLFGGRDLLVDLRIIGVQISKGAQPDGCNRIIVVRPVIINYPLGWWLLYQYINDD
jgi:hypothetical protein